MISEKKFIIDGIKQGLRSDGRSCLRSRTLEFFDNTELLAAGSAQLAISLYSPHIICGVKAEISTAPDVLLSIEVAGKSNQGFRERLKEIGKIIERLMIRYLDRQQLVIIEGKKAWKLFVDVLILQESTTNLIEHISFTVWKALRNVKLIGVEGFVNKNTGEDFLQLVDMEKTLVVDDLPVIISVSLVSETLVLDLSDLEEHCSEVTLHISVDSTTKLKGLCKEGPGSISPSATLRSISLSTKAAASFFSSQSSPCIFYKLDEI